MTTGSRFLLLFFMAPLAVLAQHAILISDDHEGTVLRFDFSDPMLQEVETPSGLALIPRVLDDTPLLRAGAPDLSKVDVTLLIGHDGGTMLEVVDVQFSDMQVDLVAPSKGNLYRNIDPATVPFEQGDLYGEDGFFPSEPAVLRTPFVERGLRGQAVWAHPLPIQPGHRGAARLPVNHRPRGGDGGGRGQCGPGHRSPHTRIGCARIGPLHQCGDGNGAL